MRPASALEERLQVRANNGRFTNPLLECDVASGIIDTPKVKFSKDLTEEIKAIKKENPNLDISVYYRDLNNGPTFGYQADVPFIPASLLKVPTIMSLYKYEEREEGFLETKLHYSSSSPASLSGQYYPSPDPMIHGTDYSIRELGRRSIQYSDNNAIVMLNPLVDEQEIMELARQLDISFTTGEVSVKEYSAVFRILFNASYLSQEDSEEILVALTQSSFTEGLRLGVPAEVIVAHKFGERTGPSMQQQFHDCGIIYYPKHPYLLCVMTKGSDTKSSVTSISRISAFTYKKINEAYADN